METLGLRLFGKRRHKALDDGALDFSKFTDRELLEAYGSIDEYYFPVNYARLTAELQRRKISLRSEWPAPPEPAPPEPEVRRRPYVPNHIPAEIRLQCMVLSLLQVIFGAFALHEGNLYIPEVGTHFTGTAALLAFGGILSAVAGLLTVVVDHYDKRDNEEEYQALGFLSYVVAFGFYVAAYFVQT